MDQQLKYYRLLAEKYPTVSALSREIINLSAILNLPKGTEHFMSDLHGEYDAFYHIVNNCSGVVREKVNMIFRDSLSEKERDEICMLIYYPVEKLDMARKQNLLSEQWYNTCITRLLAIAATLSSKYTRSKVRKAMPSDYAYIIDELLHAQKDEDNNQERYHREILNTIIEINPKGFIVALAELIKRLAVDRIHIVGDIFDRGESADKIMDVLMSYPSLDIEWGNHDILWIGAASGSNACIANVVRNAVKYNTVRTLESGYGISLRNLALYAEKNYTGTPMEAALKAITVMQFKLEGHVILRHPEYEMQSRLLLDKMDLSNKTVQSEGVTYPLCFTEFPTLDPDDPYALTEEESFVIDELRSDFLNSERLQRHAAFLVDKGSMYRVHNGNLLYHGCVPLDPDGTLESVMLFGTPCHGRRFLDLCEAKARRAYHTRPYQKDDTDFLWYLWCGKKSPLCGRNIKTFERAFIPDQAAWHEEKNPYYDYYTQEDTCLMILREFGLNGSRSHIVNGHTPVKTGKGELPVKSGGRLLVIDGGFCKAYHRTTGIAGYTLIYNSHGLRIKAHHPFETVEKALEDSLDIHSDNEIIETEAHRVMVRDTDDGVRIQSEIEDLKQLLRYYRDGIIEPN